MHKVIAITKDISPLRPYRHQWLHDAETGLYYVVHWPRHLQEQTAFEALPGLMHLPHIEDQMTTVSPEIVAALPQKAGVTTQHNTYQTLLRLHQHYQWDNFHPHA